MFMFKYSICYLNVEYFLFEYRLSVGTVDWLIDQLLLNNSSGSPFKSFNDIVAGSVGSNSPNADNFFSSSFNVLPQQRPAPAAASSAPLRQMSFPSQQFDTINTGASTSVMPDLQTQINNIFKKNGMW